MPVSASIAAANAVNAANGPFPAYTSSAGGPQGPPSSGKSDGSTFDGAVDVAESDVPMNSLGPASIASEPGSLGAADHIDYGNMQLPDIQPEEHDGHTSHVAHHGDDEEAHEEEKNKRNLLLWSAALALGGTGAAAGITALAIRPRRA